MGKSTINGPCSMVLDYILLTKLHVSTGLPVNPGCLKISWCYKVLFLNEYCGKTGQIHHFWTTPIYVCTHINIIYIYTLYTYIVVNPRQSHLYPVIPHFSNVSLTCFNAPGFLPPWCFCVAVLVVALELATGFPTGRWPPYHKPCCAMPIFKAYTTLIGGIPTPLKNMKVRLDHHPNYWGK